ncbi:MAG TPA: hypothetical protein VFZ65_16110 [Planctomycetota bacterium]|nr:hypothetical protein [Planctomycetota bacterium]
MENHIFLRPAVAEIMNKNFVEARHHTDIQNTMTEEQLATNRRLQAQIAGTKANPYFVVVDPKTGKKIAEHSLSGGPNAWEENWLEFLNGVLKQTGRTP